MTSAGGLTALVLAGTRPGGDALAQHAGVSHKALIEVAGRTMIERVAGALAAVREVERILISIDRAEVLAGLAGLLPPACVKPVTAIAAADSPSASVAAALERAGTPMLITTADHALLSPAWLREFLHARPAGADVAIALARKEAVLACAPGTRRTYLRFQDGDFSGCNLFWLGRPAALRVVQQWRKLEAHRKSPLKMMLQMGPGTALRYRLGRLPLRQALARLDELTGATVRVVELSDGRAAIDVDKPSDLALVRELATA